MLTLDQVHLLETKVAQAIGYVDRVNEENTLLKGKLEDYQKRIEGLEDLIQRFKEEQGRVEEGILAALNRLNKFEEDFSQSLHRESPPGKDASARNAGSGDTGTGGVEGQVENEGKKLFGEDEAEMIVPDEDESEESDVDILFAAEEDEQGTSVREEPYGEGLSSDKPADATELDIF
ncbi:MAG: hypothetical protein LBG76_05485 [Treponema sp.]|jgi:hypothetical protein|nr:hypothetical protein [Treponema sp.]